VGTEAIRPPGGISRRQALTRAGAALVWVTPVVQTIEMSAAAAQTGTGVIKEAGDVRLTSITLRYLGGSIAHGGAPPCDGTGTASGSVVDPVRLYALWGAGASQVGGYPATACTSAQGDPTVFATGVTVGNVFVFGDGVTGMQPRIELLVFDSNEGCTLTRIHTSCSVAIAVGDICGQWQVVAGTQ